MAGVPKIIVQESASVLKKLMNEQKESRRYAKVQSLYMLKTGKAKTVRQAAQTLGKGEATVHRWLRLYREGGIEKLLLEKKSPGTPKKFSVEQAAKVQKELRDPQGFSSYKEVRLW